MVPRDRCPTALCLDQSCISLLTGGTPLPSTFLRFLYLVECLSRFIIREALIRAFFTFRLFATASPKNAIFFGNRANFEDLVLLDRSGREGVKRAVRENTKFRLFAIQKTFELGRFGSSGAPRTVDQSFADRERWGKRSICLSGKCPRAELAVRLKVTLNLALWCSTRYKNRRKVQDAAISVSSVVRHLPSNPVRLDFASRHTCTFVHFAPVACPAPGLGSTRSSVNPPPPPRPTHPCLLREEGEGERRIRREEDGTTCSRGDLYPPLYVLLLRPPQLPLSPPRPHAHPEALAHPEPPPGRSGPIHVPVFRESRCRATGPPAVAPHAMVEGRGSQT